MKNTNKFTGKYGRENQLQNGAAILLAKDKTVTEIIDTQHVQHAVAAFDKALADMARKTLEAHIKAFESEGDFKLFCRDRLTVISFEDNEFRKEMYLDYESPEEPGIFLFKFSTEITTKYENGVLTTTFG
jgi:hypothetical protein